MPPVVVVLLVLALASSRVEWVWAAAAASAIDALATATKPYRRPETFSAVLGCVGLGVAGFLHNSAFAPVFTGFLLVVAALSAFTPFCLGRFAYVLVFSSRPGRP